MELVSAAKMRRATMSALATRPYAHTAWDLVRHLSFGADRRAHPLLAIRPLRRSIVLVIGSNRGLCGSFNNQIVQKSFSIGTRDSQQGAQEVCYITFGKRVREAVLRQGKKIIADFPKKDITTSILDISGIAHLILDEYGKGTIDRVSICYSTFVSTVKQRVGEKYLLPFEYDPEHGEGITDRQGVREESAGEKQDYSLYVFEPSEEKVLAHILPRLVETQLFQAVLESEASEQSARMMAMHNATEAASDMLAGLQLGYNQLRQTAITQEIAEISSGRAALEN